MFNKIQTAVAGQFKKMSAGTLYSTTADGAAMWDVYLGSFPAGANPIYKTRTEHDCGCCRHFIKSVGGVVGIDEAGELVTIWDVAVGGDYQVVADAMAAFVRTQTIDNIYLHYERMVGTAASRQLLEDKTVKTWGHFHVNLPDAVVKRKAEIRPSRGEAQATHDVMKRGLEEITRDSIHTVLDLIAQGSLYRGEEHKFAVIEFEKLQAKFGEAGLRDTFVWASVMSVHPSVSRIRNTVIGTLLVDLSDGVKELEDAVKAYEVKVAPMNYKRPTALVSEKMIAAAQATVDELGLTTALERRYATIDDLTVNNVIFADRGVRRKAQTAGSAAAAFDALAAGAAVDVKKLGKVEEVAVGDFIEKVLPSVRTVEVLVENRHVGNMVSLIAPVDPTARRLFKWENGFSWSYAGDMADSIKEKVKAAGGNVTGDFRASLAWWNHDDLDLHLQGPNGAHIWFRNKVDARTGGALDVDMNAGSGTTRTPVENITYPSRGRMVEGAYRLFVNQWQARESDNVGFEVEVEFDGTVWQFAYPSAVKQGMNVPVCDFTYSRAEGVKVSAGLTCKPVSKSVWGVTTQTFHKARVVLLSPNQWDGREVGNRHYFFMLEGCVNDGTARGFYNEFLGEELTPHRKVLEMVGAKMRTDAGGAQLSGLGFSSTQRNHVLCRLTGSFTRVVKVVF